MRSGGGRGSAAWGSSDRQRAEPRGAAAEPASTPRKFGSWPPVASAPRSTGTEPSGAVSSSWMLKRLIGVFISRAPSVRGNGVPADGRATYRADTSLRTVSLRRLVRRGNGSTPRNRRKPAPDRCEDGQPGAEASFRGVVGPDAASERRVAGAVPRG